MSCTTQVLTFQWTRHHWRREVTHTEHLNFHETDQWGRRVPTAYVRCQARLVCTTCGAVQDDGDCGCDPERADHCPARLTLLTHQQAASAGTAARPE